MKRAELQEKVNSIDWWHTIELPTDEGDIIRTPGRVDHCTEEIATQRFGIPEDLSGKTVLDVGCWNGYHSFLAEKRGAKVTAIDIWQDNSLMAQGPEGLKLARTALASSIVYYNKSLEDFAFAGLDIPLTYDVVFLFGTLYHTSNPLGHLKALSAVTGYYALIETAIAPDVELNGNLVFHIDFRPGFDNDPTNYFYFSPSALVTMLKHVGFDRVELVSALADQTRATFKAYKNPAK